MDQGNPIPFLYTPDELWQAHAVFCTPYGGGWMATWINPRTETAFMLAIGGKRWLPDTADASLFNRWETWEAAVLAVRDCLPPDAPSSGAEVKHD